MKNLLIVAGVLMMTSLVTSCEKDNSCECTTIVQTIAGSVTNSTSISVITASRYSAKKECEDMSGVTNSGGINTTVHCELID